MRHSARRWKRRLRRLGRWLVPEEARALARRQGRQAVAAVAALLLYADGTQACSRVGPDSVTSAVISERLIDEVSLDRAPSVVHASYRRSGAPPWRGERLFQPVAGPGSPEADPRGTPPPISPSPQPLPDPAGLAPAPGVAPAVAGRAITQGQFAILLAKTLRLRPPRRGWSPLDASSVLSGLRLRPGQAVGVVPPGDWRLDQPLTEADLASLLGHLGLTVVASRPERQISREEAEHLLARLASLFRSLAPAAYSASSAGAGALTLGNPRPPFSPSTP